MADIRIFTGRNCGWAVRNYAALIEKGIKLLKAKAVVSPSGGKHDFGLTVFAYTYHLAQGRCALGEVHHQSPGIQWVHPLRVDVFVWAFEYKGCSLALITVLY